MEPITVIIETTKGSDFKCDYEPETGYMKLKKTMPMGSVFPFDFGFIPYTKGGDGDPLDVLIISELHLFVGCALDCRIIGAIKAEQKEKNSQVMRNDRLIGIPIVSSLYRNVQKLSDFPRKVLEEIELFFVNYNQQAGKSFKPIERLSAKKSMQLILAAKTQQFDKKVELFVPLTNQKGNPYPKEKYDRLHDELIKNFGGLTRYTITPTQGMWQETQQKVVKDNIIVYEVMSSGINHQFWKKCKKDLCKEFNQKEIIIRVTDISLI